MYIKLTGWINSTDAVQTSKNSFTVPFSSHSNFNELELFVSSIRPGRLMNLNTLTRAPLYSAGEIKRMNQYLFFLQNMYQRGLDFFKENYVDSTKLSKVYLSY